jgi:hypothetical protein
MTRIMSLPGSARAVVVVSLKLAQIWWRRQTESAEMKDASAIVYAPRISAVNMRTWLAQSAGAAPRLVERRFTGWTTSSIRGLRRRTASMQFQVRPSPGWLRVAGRRDTGLDGLSCNTSEIPTATLRSIPAPLYRSRICRLRGMDTPCHSADAPSWLTNTIRLACRTPDRSHRRRHSPTCAAE